MSLPHSVLLTWNAIPISLLGYFLWSCQTQLKGHFLGEAFLDSTQLGTLLFPLSPHIHTPYETLVMLFFFFNFFFECGQFLKSLLNFLPSYFCFMLCFFAREASLAPQSRIEPAPRALEVKVLITGWPRSPMSYCILTLTSSCI